VLSALVLSVVLAGAALIDQLAVHSLSDHANEMYAGHGKEVEPAVLYGLLYTVAALGALLWLLPLRAVRSGSRWASPLVGGVAVLTAAVAVALLASREYGDQVYPALWGLLALLPAMVGALAIPTGRREQIGATRSRSVSTQ
jgi:fermentation-respiration switch protein FrsA (DUF1100 family)